MTLHPDIAAVLAGERRWALHVGDCRELLAALPEWSVDHVITDPPFSAYVHTQARSGVPVSAQKVVVGYNADGSRKIRDRRGDEPEIRRRTELGFAHLDASVRRAVARQASRAVRRWLLVFSDALTAPLWRLSLVASGLDYVRTLIWTRHGAPQFTGDRPAVGFEQMTLVHQPGRKRWNGGGRAGVYDYPIVHHASAKDTREHPAQKPIDLMLALVADFTDPGDIVLDPFAGSGTTGVAALRLGRRVILCERDPVFAAVARERMEAEERGSTLQAARAGQASLFGEVP